MPFRCPKCSYRHHDLDVMTRHIDRHKNPAPKVLTQTYSADKNASRDKEHS